MKHIREISEIEKEIMGIGAVALAIGWGGYAISKNECFGMLGIAGGVICLSDAFYIYRNHR